MKKFTILFLVLALAVSAFAGKTDVQKGKVNENPQVVREFIPDDRPAVQGEASPVFPVKRSALSGVAAPLAPGTYTIGAAGTFATITAAVAALNLDGVTGTGNVIFEFIDAAYVDTGISIGPVPGQGAATPIIFRPATGVVASIRITGGNPVVSNYNLRLNQAAYVTFDGSNSGGADRSLTLYADTTTLLASQNRNGVLVQRGSQNITIKNMVIRGTRRSANAGGFDVARINNATFAAAGKQRNITIDNCQLFGGGAGVSTASASQTVRDSNVVITNNLIGGAASANFFDNLNFGGFSIEGNDGLLIQGNDINGVKTATGSSIQGIRLTGGYSNTLINRNKIHNIRFVAGTGRIISLLIGNAATTSYNTIIATATIQMNAFYDMDNTGTGSTAGDAVIYNPTGPPNTGSGAGSNITYIYNTWNLDYGTSSKAVYGIRGNFAGSLQPGLSDVLTLTNNLVFCKSSGTQYAFSFFEPNDPVSGELVVTSDYNLYHASQEASSGVWGYFPVPFPEGSMAGGNSQLVGTFQNWLDSSGTLNDINSSNGAAIFQPASYLVSEALGDLTAADSLATPLVGFTTDFDGQTRNATFPDAGVDEFVNTPVTNDGGPISLLGPSIIGIPANVAATVIVNVKNYGIVPISIPVRVKVTDPLAVEIYNVVETVPSVAANSQTNYTFTATVPIAGVGNYTVTATTEVPADERTFNDGPISIVCPAQPSAPGVSYSINWNDSLPGNWVGTGDFQLGNFAKLGGAHGDSATGNAWVTKLVGDYTNATHSQLVSPWFDFTSNPTPKISFWSAIDVEPEWDGSIVEYTQDGTNWTQAGVLADPNGENWYNTAGDPNQFDGANAGIVQPPFPVGPKWTGAFAWTKHQLIVPAAGGQSAVRFRYRTMQDASTAGPGFAVDDFAISVAAGVSGKVFIDVNNNGVDDSEPGLAGAIVTIAGPMTVIDTLDGTGVFAYDLVDGNYTVSAVGAGTQTVPATNYPIVVAGSPISGLVFGFYNPASIAGNVYDDVNHNGANNSEPALAGVTINLAGPVPASTVTDTLGNFSFVVQVPGAYTVTATPLAGYTQLQPALGGYAHAINYGDVVTGDVFGHAAATSILSFRTASMNNWATAVDGKGKSSAIKCKPLTVDFDFNIVAPDSSLGTVSSVKVKLGMLATGVMLEGIDTVATFAGVKEFTYTAAIPGGTSYQIIGKGTKGKAVKAQGTWFATLLTKAKKYNFKVLAYNANIPRLPMPNLINVLSELPSWPTLGNAAGASSVIHPKFKDVLKTLNKKGVLHTGVARCINTFANGKPIAKQQKALPPDKHSNVLVAEVLTLGLNIGASTAGKFPTGLGALLYDNVGDTSSATFNGSTLSAILTRANLFLGCNPDTTADAVDYFNVISLINGAFVDTNGVDTVSWACGGVVMTGVRQLKDVTFLRALPGFVQPKVDPTPGPSQVPSVFALNQNYPNPFNPTTTISFELPEAGIVNLKVYNMLGQEVATLLNNVEMSEGEDEVDFDAASLPSGVYFYRLTINTVDDEGTVLGQSFTQVKKMMLVK